MKIYILGMDGYIGWRLKGYLEERNHIVEGCDNFSRRERAASLVPTVRDSTIRALDVCSTDQLADVLREFKPDCVVHLAEIPSAPFSMIDAENTMLTQQNNILGSLSVALAMVDACPHAHLLKLGTMGEFGPSSWYHMSKVCDTENIKYACRTFGLCATDVMQGPVYGVGGRFDYDEVWGTVVNRWICMGLAGMDLLVYGDGNQVRGFLPIDDALRCFELQMLNPPSAGEYRVVCQYAQKWRLKDLATLLSTVLKVGVAHIENPRIEDDVLEAGGTNDWLTDHGYKPSRVEDVIEQLVDEVYPYRNNIDVRRFIPVVKWVEEI